MDASPPCALDAKRAAISDMKRFRSMIEDGLRLFGGFGHVWRSSLEDVGMVSTREAPRMNDSPALVFNATVALHTT